MRGALQPNAGKGRRLCTGMGSSCRFTTIPKVLLEREQPDLWTTSTEVGAKPLSLCVHAVASRASAKKPMAPTPGTRGPWSPPLPAGHAFYVHENWRWQAPLRAPDHNL